MNITARRINGDRFSNVDMLEVVLSTDNQDMKEVAHSIKQVSGVPVTHGGGAKAGDFLHYKSNEVDSDADGIIDYSNIEMRVVQESVGTSVIKVVCSYILKSEADAYEPAMEAWVKRYEAASESGVQFTEETPTFPTPLELETGEITLEWSEDTFV